MLLRSSRAFQSKSLMQSSMRAGDKTSQCATLASPLVPQLGSMAPA